MPLVSTPVRVNGNARAAATEASDDDDVIALDEEQDNSETVRKLREEISRLQRANRELYRFAADTLVGDKDAD